MGFISVVAVLLLISCAVHVKAAPQLTEFMNDDPVFDEPKSVEKFKLRITEKGTKFNERIYIDKKRGIQYFKVPAHNGLSASDNLYDFKMNITVSRDKKKAVCHVRPLPSNLPRPDAMSKALKSLSHAPPSHNVRKVMLQWTVGPKADKSSFRKEVRDFCGNFPIYRLVPYSRDSVAVGNGKVKRQGTVPLCDSLPTTRCDPMTWSFTCKIATTTCVYYLTCNDIKLMFKTTNCMQHLYNSIVCCIPKCPSTG